MTGTGLLFATIAAGGGHVATARAMADAVDRYFPDQFDLRVSDLMFDLGLVRQDRQHKDFWRWALAHPPVVRAGQRLLDAAPTLTRRTHQLMLRRLARMAAHALGQDPPRLIIANHGWLTVALTRAQRRHGLPIGVLSFATEPLDASALWAEPRAERFLVPSESARRDLIRLGVAPERIDVVGYPVGRTFLEAPAQPEARARLGLEDRFTCLLVLGGEGIGAVPRELLRKLLTMELSLVVMTGRNTALSDRLQCLTADFPTLRVEGFTDRMATYVAASDVVIGKAGPASVFETLAVGRPFLATSYAGLNEKKVVTFLEERRLGGLFPSARRLANAVRFYHERLEEREAVRERAAALDIGRMTEALARYIVHYARFGTRDPEWVSRGLS